MAGCEWFISKKEEAIKPILSSLDKTKSQASFSLETKTLKGELEDFKEELARMSSKFEKLKKAIGQAHKEPRGSHPKRETEKPQGENEGEMIVSGSIDQIALGPLLKNQKRKLKIFLMDQIEKKFSSFESSNLLLKCHHVSSVAPVNLAKTPSVIPGGNSSWFLMEMEKTRREMEEIKRKMTEKIEEVSMEMAKEIEKKQKWLLEVDQRLQKGLKGVQERVGSFEMDFMKQWGKPVNLSKGPKDKRIEEILRRFQGLFETQSTTMSVVESLKKEMKEERLSSLRKMEENEGIIKKSIEETSKMKEKLKEASQWLNGTKKRLEMMERRQKESEETVQCYFRELSSLLEQNDVENKRALEEIETKLEEK